MLHRFGEFEFDERVYELRRGGTSIAIEPRSLDLLAYFLHHRGRLIRHDELIREVWQGTAVSRSAIAFAISNLRAALGRDAGAAYVTTVHGRGYRFAGEAPPSYDAGECADAGDADVAADAEWEPLAAGADVAALPFVGRRRELLALEQALERAAGGRRCLSLLSGEAGIGKTRLAEEHAERARTRELRVLVGRCIEDDLAPDYWPWLQLVRAALESDVSREAPVFLRRWAEGAAHWGDTLGLGAGQAPGRTEVGALGAAGGVRADGGALGAARFRLFDAIVQYLGGLARRRPTLIVLEDLHGADRASLRLLELFGRSSRDARISLVATYRSPEPGRALADTIAALARDPETRVFELGPLARPDVGRLVRSALGGAARPDFGDAIFARTEGHPLFVSEMCRSLARERERWRTAGPEDVSICGGVRDAIRARVARTSEPCRELLEVASVLGRDLSTDTLLQIADAPGAKPLAAIDEAIEARLFDAPAGLARLRFCHALVREVVYDAMPLQRRAELHHRAAEALAAASGASAGDAAAECARHLLLAGPLADPYRVVDTCVTEARRAASRLAFEGALAQLDQAIQVLAQRVPADTARRCDLLLEQAELAAQTGDAARARASLVSAVALARKLRSPERLARAALADPGASSPTIIPTDQVALLEEALAGLPATASPLRVELLARLSNLLHWSDAEARRSEAADQALAMARALDEPRPLGRALLARHLQLWTPDRIDERLEIADECLRLARVSGDRELLAFSHQARATIWFERADAVQFRHEVDALRRLLAQIPPPLLACYRCWLAVVDGTRAFLAGRFADAERHAGEAAALEGFDAEEARRWMGLLLFSIRMEQGRLAELEPLLPLIAQQSAPLDAWRAALVLLHAAAGRIDDARHEFSLVATGSWRHRRDATWLPTLAMIAQVTALGDDRESAQRLVTLLEPYADRILVLAQGVCSYGSVARHLGLLEASLGHFDAAIRHLERALEIAARWDAAIWLARGRCELGSVLLTQGDPRERRRAQALLAEGVAAAQRLGLRPLAWLAAQASGAPRRPSALPARPSRGVALTER